MDIPDSVVVKGGHYKIEVIPIVEEGGVDCEGLIDIEKRIIYISGALEPCLQFKALLHEMFHAVLYESCATSGELSEEMEEFIVENISRFMYDTFQMRWKK